MASRPWTDAELTVLERHVDEGNWLSTVSRKLSQRSTKAIKVRMARLRSELGLGDGRRADVDDMASFHARAITASEMLREATLSVGTWS